MKIISQKHLSLKHLDLKAIAKGVAKVLPKNMGFAIVLFEFDKEETPARFISNAPAASVGSVFTGLVNQWTDNAKPNR